MPPAFEEIPDTIPPRPNGSGVRGSALHSKASEGGFFWKQVHAAGLGAVAEKVAAGHALDLGEVIALSRASLPLLGKMVQLRPEASDAVLITLHRDVLNPGEAAAALPIDRVTSLPKFGPCIGQGLADWISFCRTLLAIRDEARSNGETISWYPIVGQPLDRDLGCDGNLTGAEVLRMIALARLVLPAAVQVRAPLAALGPKVAQVALDFGASHLGHVAPDGQTPSDPLIADARVLDELLESNSPTEIS